MADAPKSSPETAKSCPTPAAGIDIAQLENRIKSIRKAEIKAKAEADLVALKEDMDKNADCGAIQAKAAALDKTLKENEPASSVDVARIIQIVSGASFETYVKTGDSEGMIRETNAILETIKDPKERSTVEGVVGGMILQELTDRKVKFSFTKSGVEILSVPNDFPILDNPKKDALQKFVNGLISKKDSPYPEILRQGLLQRSDTFKALKPEDASSAKLKTSLQGKSSDADKMLAAALDSPIFAGVSDQALAAALSKQADVAKVSAQARSVEAAISSGTRTAAEKAGGAIGTAAGAAGGLIGTGAIGGVEVFAEMLAGAQKEGGGLGVLAIIAALIYSLFKFGPLKTLTGFFVAGLAGKPGAIDELNKLVDKAENLMEGKVGGGKTETKAAELSEFQKAANRQAENDPILKAVFAKREKDPKAKKLSEYLTTINTTNIQSLPLSSPLFSLDPQEKTSVFSNEKSLPAGIAIPAGMESLLFKRVLRAYMGVPTNIESGAPGFTGKPEIVAWKKRSDAASGKTLSDFLSQSA